MMVSNTLAATTYLYVHARDLMPTKNGQNPDTLHNMKAYEFYLAQIKQEEYVLILTNDSNVLCVNSCGLLFYLLWETGTVELLAVTNYQWRLLIE